MKLTRGKSGRRLAVGAGVLALIVPLSSGSVAALRYGTMTYNGGSAGWANGTQGGGTSVYAETSENYNLSRVRAQVYYRATSGAYYWSSNGWDNDSYDSISRTGEGIMSKHSVDTNFSGSYGRIYKSV